MSKTKYPITQKIILNHIKREIFINRLPGGYLSIQLDNLKPMIYLYYTRREAIKRFKEKYTS